jgi:acetyltransferase-like isoleucine patch superfamily enzyme
VTLENDIQHSQLPASVKLGQLCRVLHSQLGEKCMVGSFSKLAYTRMGDLSYVGDYTTVIQTEIGKFTSISWGVTLGPEEHDYTRITNHSFLYSMRSFDLTPREHYDPRASECRVGHDVWIGCNSTILRGVRVGNGAVIGANALVGQDVPAYAIAVGSPARVIKYRFEAPIIDALLELAWWDIPISTISQHTELFAARPTLEAIERIAELKAASGAGTT